MTAIVLGLCSLGAFGQNLGSAGTVKGTVADPSGAVIPGATATIHNLVTGFSRTALTDSSGGFSFTNVPFNPYHLTVTATGFAQHKQDVDLSSMVPVSLRITLELAGEKTTVTVTSEAADLIEVDPMFPHRCGSGPLRQVTARKSVLVTQFFGDVVCARDLRHSDGLFHGFGDHAENSFSIDGQPISDQQSKIFSNQLPVDAVQSLEVIQGAPPAEYGDKTSLVIVATTRSGLGETMPHGAVTASYGTFGSATAGFNLAYGQDKWGNLISANGLNSTRFLDPPELNVIHDRGNERDLSTALTLSPRKRTL